MNRRSDLEDLKKWALQSGFPLENDVHAILQLVVAPEGAVEKDIPFESTDGEERSQLRSIDFKATISRPMEIFPSPRGAIQPADLNFIVDAKFTLDEDKNRFWFIPSAKNPQDFSFPFLTPQARVIDGSNEARQSFRRELVQLAICPTEYRLASLGRKVSEIKDGRESLAAYQVQVLEAVAHFVRKHYLSLGKTDSTNEHRGSPQVYIPIVVTNSPLFMLKDSITISQVLAATSETAICDSIDFVAVEAPNIHYVKEALRKLCSNVRDHGNHNLRWKYSELKIAPVIFCNLASLKALLESFVTRFKAISERAS